MSVGIEAATLTMFNNKTQGMSGYVGILVLLALNAVPLVGVLMFNWASFDLIFLYWLENLVIGGFVILRMVVRPYNHPVDLIFPALLAPFFMLHYGMFCYGHGSFIVSLFGKEAAANASGDLLGTMQLMLSSPVMMAALGALSLLQLFNWLNSIRQKGFGSEGAAVLMVSPYRRIVVLHLTILCGGFALMALDEPTVGLILLIAIKTVADALQWRKNKQLGESQEFVFTDAHLAEMQEKFPEPMVKVNGKERHFESFAALKASSEFRIAQALMRLIGASEELKAMRAYMDMKIAEERRGRSLTFNLSRSQKG